MQDSQRIVRSRSDIIATVCKSRHEQMPSINSLPDDTAKVGKEGQYRQSLAVTDIKRASSTSLQESDGNNPIPNFSKKVEAQNYDIAVMPHIDDVDVDANSSTSDSAIYGRAQGMESLGGPIPSLPPGDPGIIRLNSNLVNLRIVEDNDSSDPPDVMAGDMGPTEGVDTHKQYLSDDSSSSTIDNENDITTTPNIKKVDEIDKIQQLSTFCTL